MVYNIKIGKMLQNWGAIHKFLIFFETTVNRKILKVYFSYIVNMFVTLTYVANFELV